MEIIRRGGRILSWSFPFKFSTITAGGCVRHAMVDRCQFTICPPPKVLSITDVSVCSPLSSFSLKGLWMKRGEKPNVRVNCCKNKPYPFAIPGIETSRLHQLTGEVETANPSSQGEWEKSLAWIVDELHSQVGWANQTLWRKKLGWRFCGRQTDTSKFQGLCLTLE